MPASLFLAVTLLFNTVEKTENLEDVVTWYWDLLMKPQ